MLKRLTSWKSQRGTDPGLALAFSIAAVEVRSRHRASTMVPFFSFETLEHVSFILVAMEGRGRISGWTVNCSPLDASTGFSD